MIHKLLTGAEFNKEYEGREFIKLTNESEIHNNYQFKTGLNIDSVSFDPTGNCRAGGLYFCLLDELSRWLHYSYEKPMFYARVVTVPMDARVWIEEDKFKADRFILGDHVVIGDLDVWTDANYCLRACQLNGFALKYVKNQTEMINLQAVRQNGHALQFVKEQTEEINLRACKSDGCALQYVKEKKESICLLAVSRSGYALQFVEDQTEEICLAAVKREGGALQYVKAQTEAICLAAVESNLMAIRLVNEHTEAICMAAFGNNWLVLQHINAIYLGSSEPERKILYQKALEQIEGLVKSVVLPSMTKK
jgi:hypothetical protein